MNQSVENDPLLADYERDGFVVIREFIGGEIRDEFSGQVDRFIRDIIPSMPPEHAFYEDKSNPATLKQLQRMGDHDSWFHRQFVSGKFRELAEHLLRGPVTPKNLQYFNKPPGVGKPTPPHQDGFYFMLEPCEAVTMWLALDAVDEVNGCVRYVRGSHRAGLRNHARTQTLGFSQGIVDYPNAGDAANEVLLPAKPGDLLAHDARTIHRADGNRSATRSRRALGFVYYSHRAREDSAAHEAYQRRLTEDLTSAGKI